MKKRIESHFKKKKPMTDMELFLKNNPMDSTTLNLFYNIVKKNAPDINFSLYFEDCPKCGEPIPPESECHHGLPKKPYAKYQKIYEIIKANPTYKKTASK